MKVRRPTPHPAGSNAANPCNFAADPLQFRCPAGGNLSAPSGPGYDPRSSRAQQAAHSEEAAMINRRTFGALLAGAAVPPKRAWSQNVTAKTVYYSGVGPELALYDVDIAGAALQKRASVTLPANVQYAWPHPSKRYLYVVSSSGGPAAGGAAGTTHVANAFRVDPASGELQPHGEQRALPSRPIHTSVDRSGEFLLIAYNDPSNATVHRIN